MQLKLVEPKLTLILHFVILAAWIATLFRNVFARRADKSRPTTNEGIRVKPKITDFLKLCLLKTGFFLDTDPLISYIQTCF